MKTRYTVILSVIAGAALGGAAIQGLHAQGKPKAYQVTELEIIDNAAWQEFVKAVRASQQAASGRNLRTAMGKVVAFVGAPPNPTFSTRVVQRQISGAVESKCESNQWGAVAKRL